MSNLYPNQVIFSGHMTEKASLVGQFANAYVFKVSPKASKIEVKKAVEEEFKVTVNKVNILNVKGKLKLQCHANTHRPQGSTSYRIAIYHIGRDKSLADDLAYGML
jgi:large subunit ribosomal protein L23